MANIQFGGLISGLDTNALITGLGNAERGQVNVLKGQKTVLLAQQGVYTSLVSALARLKSAAQNLSLSSDFSKKSAVSSDSSVLTASADSSALAGNNTVIVDTLAKAQSVKSITFNSSSAAIGTGSLTLQVGSKSTIVIVDSSNNTLSSLKSAINGSGAAVSASIVNAGSEAAPDYRLIVQSKESGTDNAITIGGTLTGGDDPFVSGGQIVQAAANAVLSVNGLTVSRSSNTVSDVLPGVTLSLLKEGDHDGVVNSLDATAKVAVSADRSALSGSIKNIIDSYNAVNKIVNGQFSLDPNTKRQGTLAGDSAVRAVIGRLRAELSAPGGIGAGIASISDIGISFQKDGSLTLDDSKLASALASDPTGVGNLFALVQNGIGKRIPDAIDGFISPIGGSLISRQQGVQNNIDRIDAKVASEEKRIANLQDRLAQQFTSLEKLLSQLKSQGDFLTQQLGALSTQINSRK